MTYRQAHATLTDLPDLELVERFQRGSDDALQVVITPPAHETVPVVPPNQKQVGP